MKRTEWKDAHCTILVQADLILCLADNSLFINGRFVQSYIKQVIGTILPKVLTLSLSCFGSSPSTTDVLIIVSVMAICPPVIFGITTVVI